MLICELLLSVSYQYATMNKYVYISLSPTEQQILQAQYRAVQTPPLQINDLSDLKLYSYANQNFQIKCFDIFKLDSDQLSSRNQQLKYMLILLGSISIILLMLSQIVSIREQEDHRDTK